MDVTTFVLLTYILTVSYMASSTLYSQDSTVPRALKVLLQINNQQAV